MLIFYIASNLHKKIICKRYNYENKKTTKKFLVVLSEKDFLFGLLNFFTAIRLVLLHFPQQKAEQKT